MGIRGDSLTLAAVAGSQQSFLVLAVVCKDRGNGEEGAVQGSPPCCPPPAPPRLPAAYRDELQCNRPTAWHQKSWRNDPSQAPSPISRQTNDNHTAQNPKENQRRARGIPQQDGSLCPGGRREPGGAEATNPGCRARPHPRPRAGTQLTGTDGREIPHVPEQPADSGAGTRVEPVPTDAQVELEPAGLWPQWQQRGRGRQVELLPVQLVSPAGQWARGEEDEARDGNPRCSGVAV